MKDKKLYLFVTAIGVIFALYVIFITITNNIESFGYTFNPETQEIQDNNGDINNAALNTNAIGQKMINATQNSVVVSPYLLGNVTASFMYGANEDGKKQAMDIIGLEESEARGDLFALNKELNNGYNENTKDVSAIAIHSLKEPDDSYLENFKYLNTYLTSLDFDDFYNVKTQINSYSNEETQSKIPTLVENVYPGSDFIMSSGINFESTYAEYFNITSTQSGSFNGNEKEMISAIATVSLYEDENALYYSIALSEGYIYEVFMPKEVESPLAMSLMNEYKAKAQKENVNLTMPNIDMSTYSYLKDNYKELGFTLAFEDGEVLSNMSSSIEVTLDEITQYVNVKIDSKENQTELIANKAITVDKPYYFSITNSQNSARIIMGKNN